MVKKACSLVLAVLMMISFFDPVMVDAKKVSMEAVVNHDMYNDLEYDRQREAFNAIKDYLETGVKKGDWNGGEYEVVFDKYLLKKGHI